ncbi:MAG: gliding motility-associated C-terminal domain-containing protein [Flavobacteriales bacterium]|nr:gliding motility-associated C-terminal domain-containing protein [Flavobacteriales bacterium]
MATQINLSVNYNGINTCDYFNRCSLNPNAVPETNFISPLSPANGDAMAGLNYSKDPLYFYHEIIWAKTLYSLKKGTFYCFSSQISASRNSNFFSNPFEVLFSIDTIPQNNFLTEATFNFSPQISFKNPVTNTEDWKEIKSGMIASEEYQYFYMGRLFNYEDTLILNPNYDGSEFHKYIVYFFIDDLQLTEISRPEFQYTHTCEGAALAASVSGADSVRWYRNGQLFSQQPNILLTDIETGESLMAEYFLCNYTFTDTLTVPPCTVPEPEFPNIITPNADGVNDAFTVEHLPPGSSLIIYNRWGNEVFRTAHYNNNWQGTTETLGIETKVPDGTYFYVLITTEGKQYKGTITIVR